MAERNPIEQYIDQIRDLFNQILDGQKTIPEENLPADLEQQIADLEKSIQAFCDFNEGMLKTHQISEDDIKRAMDEKNAVQNPTIKRILDKTKKLKKDVQIQVDMMKHSREVLQKHHAKFGKPGDQKSMVRKRQKRFRQFGTGDWIKS